jgi:NhaP-type Na+/H+ or K+/H+ antiporter
MLLSLALVLSTALLFSGVFNRLKLPGLIGMMCAGMLLGPHGFNLIDASLLNISSELRQIALIVILLRAGLALDLEDLKKIGRPAFLLSFVPASFEIIAITLLGPKFLGLSIIDSALLGSIIAAVSPAVVVPRMLNLMQNEKANHKRIPQLIMAGASVDDVFVIVLFTSFLALAQGQEVNAFTFVRLPIGLVIGILTGIIFSILLVLFFKKFHIRDTVKFLIILSASFILVNIESYYGKIIPFSGYIAILAMGISLLEKYPIMSHRLSHKFNKAWVAAEILLFVLVGAIVDLKHLQFIGLSALILLTLGLIFRSIGVLVSITKNGFNPKEKIFSTIAYIPKATVQAAIGAIPLSVGLESGNTILAMAVLAILVTAPLGAIGMDKLRSFIEK